MTKVYVSALYCERCNLYCKGHKHTQPCEVCGEEMKWRNVLKGSEQDPRTYTEQTNIAFKENIRVSHSMGVPIKQFEEAKKLHPGVEWKKVGNSMCPVIRNRTDKLRIMRQAGFEEYPNNYFEQCEGKGR